MNNGFLPISRQDMEERNIEQLDFVFVIGDAYVDHPSFGHAIISRVLEAHGYSVGIISQPDWKDDRSITILGKPRLAFLIAGFKSGSTIYRKYSGFVEPSIIAASYISGLIPENAARKNTI